MCTWPHFVHFWCKVKGGCALSPPGVSCCILEQPAKFPRPQKHSRTRCPLPSFLPGSFHLASPAPLCPGPRADNLPLLVNVPFILLKCVKKKMCKKLRKVSSPRGSTLHQARLDEGGTEGDSSLRRPPPWSSVCFSPHNRHGAQSCSRSADVETEAQRFFFFFFRIQRA